MNYKKVSRYIVLVVLFFLPVTFLLFLYPATHNYTPLDIVNSKVLDLDEFSGLSNDKVALEGNITVLGFIGLYPESQLIPASNLKELVYDKFKGFKKFQVVMIVPKGTENAVEKLRTEISSYEDLRFWHFAFSNESQIKELYTSLKIGSSLNNDLSSDFVFVIDKELNQRGRIDDRTDKEIEKNKTVYGLNAYNCIEVAEIKNKMSDDLRILFTEYRQKRKGEFNSDVRRANDLNNTNEDI